MQTGGKQVMRLLNDALADYVAKGLVAPDEAYLKAVDKDDLIERLGRVGVQLDPQLLAAAAAASVAAGPAIPEPPAALPHAAPAAPSQGPLQNAPFPGAAPAPGAGGTGDPFEQFRRNKRQR